MSASVQVCVRRPAGVRGATIMGRHPQIFTESDIGAGRNAMRPLTSLIVRRESVFRRLFNG
jgi:hypothetical protein